MSAKLNDTCKYINRNIRRVDMNVSKLKELIIEALNKSEKEKLVEDRVDDTAQPSDNNKDEGID